MLILTKVGAFLRLSSIYNGPSSYYSEGMRKSRNRGINLEITQEALTVEKRLLDVREAARYLGISPHTVRGWVYQGRLPVIRLGRKVLFDRTALDRLIEERSVSAT